MKYFISAFLEIEEIPENCVTSEIVRDLTKVGNIFETREEAFASLSKIKAQLRKDA